MIPRDFENMRGADDRERRLHAMTAILCCFPKLEDAEKCVQETFLRLLLAALPEAIRSVIEPMGLLLMCSRDGHFAAYFAEEEEDRVRRIVTDSHLYELHDLFQHGYLDITADGFPITRSAGYNGWDTSRGFFDGTHLMCRPQFETCWPRVHMIEGGYKIDTSGCMIINGMLFDRLAEDFPLEGRGRPFPYQEMKDSDVPQRLRVIDGRVFFNGTEIHPIGVFEPSQTEVLDNGFTLYRRSQYRRL